MDRRQIQDQETSAAKGTHFKFPKVADEYEIQSQIGASDHSTVYKAICKSADSTMIVAIKIIDSNVEIDPTAITNINTNLSFINHPHILSPHCCFIANDGCLWIVMPFIHAGPLQAIISQRFRTGLPDQFMSILINQLLRALVFLHEKGLVHKSVKASNIFFDTHGCVLLSDLDVSKDMNKDCSSVPYWVPPEEDYSSKSDVWSVGILAMEIAYGCPPIYDQKVIKAQFSKISRRFPYDLNLDTRSGKSVVPRKFGDTLKHFVGSCLAKDPFARVSALSLLDHPFVKKGENSNFLFKSIAKGMVGIGEMFEQDKDRIIDLMKNEVQLGESSQGGGGGKVLRITGWDYNNFLFELEPDEESFGKRVRFRGETVFSYKEQEQCNKFDMKSLMHGGSDEKKEVDQAMDSETLATLLSSLLDNIDTQKEMVSMLMNHCGFMHDKDLEMVKQIKRLEDELAAEKEKSFQLELNFELLKLKLPDSDEEQEQEEYEPEPEPEPEPEQQPEQEEGPREREREPEPEGGDEGGEKEEDVQALMQLFG
ncbi:serine/threonine-protein kinase BLUS1-like [Cucurbita maxima]|uniref:Serine/threonine-protein kinase BLUS1-like n=1 Tax=Cucurbita maxima TaxID=3661 RepID=A0A6J1KYZ4_CUCMA|nr:serine/threonine-protein kinase BLUS1-like [Cucurbita maxima]